MTRDFITIAITREDEFPEEADRINRILSSQEADYVHIRKPRWTARQTESLIKNINKDFHLRLKLHDHFEILKDYGIGGVHLNSRNPVNPYRNILVSKSAHSIIEIQDNLSFEYVTLSPIFDSISKPGYTGKFDFEELRNVLTDKTNIIALGGITPSKFKLLKELGFKGAAMLSYFWI